jgi:Tetratricopeptide repeat
VRTSQEAGSACSASFHSEGIPLYELIAAFRNRSFSAATFAQRTLAIREQQLGPDHPDTATSLNNLANLYHVNHGIKWAEI